MESVIRRLRIRTLKAQLIRCQLQCDALAREFEATQTTKQKARLARRWDKAMKENHTIQHSIAVLEKQEKQARAGTDFDPRTS